MNTNLYVSYQCFKNHSDYGIVLTLKTGEELFYQFLAPSHKVLRNKWSDTQLVSIINKEEVLSYVNLAQYVNDKNLSYSLTDPELFLSLTKNYLLNAHNTEQIENDTKLLSVSNLKTQNKM